MGREVEAAQAHLAQSSEHPPVTSTFKSTEFPGARVTPEGQTTAGQRTAEEKLRAVQDPGCQEGLREWAPVAAGYEHVTRPGPWRRAGGRLKGGLLYILYTFVTREIHLSYFSTFLPPRVQRLDWEGGTEGRHPLQTVCSSLWSCQGGCKQEGQMPPHPGRSKYHPGSKSQVDL